MRVYSVSYQTKKRTRQFCSLFSSVLVMIVRYSFIYFVILFSVERSFAVVVVFVFFYSILLRSHNLTKKHSKYTYTLDEHTHKKMNANWPSRTILYFGCCSGVCCCLRLLDAIQMESFGFVVDIVVVIANWEYMKQQLTDCHITIHHLLNDADNNIRPIFQWKQQHRTLKPAIRGK